MSRLVPKGPSVCAEPAPEPWLRLLLRLLGSSLGPGARLKLLRNDAGGAVTTTSSSSALLGALSCSPRPLVLLLASSVRAHVSRFGDCGLFCGLFCLALVERAGLCGVRGAVAARLNRDLLDLCVLHLHQGAGGCRRPLDLGSSRGLLALASSLLSSKPGCGLSGGDLGHLSRLCVRAFLLTVPCTGPQALGQAVTVCVQGPSVQASAVLPGLLVDAPDLLTSSPPPPDPGRPPPRPLPVAVFSASLSGDLSEMGGGVVEAHPGVDVDSQVLGQLLELGRRLLQDGVKLLACQKVVHPVLQQHLRGHGVVVVERVGAALMEPLLKLTGARPVATLHAPVPAEAYGSVGDLQVREFGAKKMLHLVPAGATSICTVVLCHRNDTMLSELKVLCQNTETVLRLTLRDPYVLLGGGCTETYLAAYVRHKVRDGLAERASKLGCSQEECLLAAEAFCRALESPAAALEHDGGNSMVDLTHAHHWILPAGATDAEDGPGPCNCGLVGGGSSKARAFLNTTRPPFAPAPLPGGADAQPRVLDSFSAKINALRVAVETANLMLDVRLVIQDTN